MEKNNVGVLLANLGTPKAPNAKAVKAFLSEFLHDKRVVDTSRWIWCPLLHGVILPFRSPKVAKLYQSIWMEQGSPLLVHSIRQKLLLEKRLDMPVEMAMTYGHPNIKNALDALFSKGCDKIVVLPLFAQYSQSTTAAVFDKLALALRHYPKLPDFRLIQHYFDEDAYIDALVISIKAHWQKHGIPQMLVCSYHGIPERYVKNGDPYASQCLATSEKLYHKLHEEVVIKSTFQSRFGREPWLQPYTDHSLELLPKQGITRIDLITPGFSVDCLETLEEAAIQYRELFLKSGGNMFHYIPCLNEDKAHIEMMAQLVYKQMKHWQE